MSTLTKLGSSLLCSLCYAAMVLYLTYCAQYYTHKNLTLQVNIITIPQIKIIISRRAVVIREANMRERFQAYVTTTVSYLHG